MAAGQAAARGLSAEAGLVARGSMINVAAMSSGAALGFALTIGVTHWLSPPQAGAMFEIIALATILFNTMELGADTGLTRWVSRARAIGGLADVRRVVAVATGPVFVVGTAAAAAVWATAPLLAHVFLQGMDTAPAVTDIRIVAPFVPLAALSSCAVAGARGFGRMWPYLVVEGAGKPAVRVLGVAVALAGGWGLRGALVAWSLPVAVGWITGWVVLNGLIRTELRALRGSAPAARRGGAGPRRPGGRWAFTWWPPSLGALGAGGGHGRGRHRVPRDAETRQRRRLAAEFWRFAMPRGFAATFQIVVTWLDVLLVGALVSRYAAGVYAAVSKLAVVGTFALEGTRLAIAPQLSGLLARKKRSGASELYQSATRWLVLASWPLYVTFAVFPAVVLGIFGPRYTVGASALAVLSLAMLVNLGTGNVSVVLLMGGKSSWNVVNTVAALAVNLGLNLVLLPRIGIVGAAIAWAASICVDNLAAVAEIWLLLGLAPFGRGYWLVAATAGGCFAATGLAARALLGESLAGLAAGTVAGLAVYLAVIYLARQRLQLVELTAVLGLRRGSRPAAGRGGEQPEGEAA